MAQELIDKIRAAAQARGIDPELALSIARAESSLDPRAKARTSSASGLFQVTRETWKEYGGRPGKQFDPDENIRVGLDVIAKNTNMLRNTLGREPRPAEVYAAHYFGPTGARSFLSADPATPIAKVLGELAVKANPNLKGKTAGQVLAQLEGKVGSAPAAPVQAQMKPATQEVAQPPLPAAGEPGGRVVSQAVSRETSAPPRSTSAPPPSTSAPPPSTSASPAPVSAQLASLGPGYQAALALSFLADEDEKEGRDPDTGPTVAEEWLKQTASRPAGLAMEDISVKSPFAALGPSPTQPQMLAKGGEVSEPSLFEVPDYAETVAYEMYPGQKGQFTQQDAARHMLAAGTLARKYGPTAAEMLGKLHEIKTSPLRWIGSKLGVSEMPVDYEQDLHNNQLGIEAGMRSKSQKELEDLVQMMAEQAREQQTKGTPWVGRPQRPVKRAGGGEAEPTAEELEAASRPATVNPLIRRQGEAARRLAAMRDVNTLPDPRTYAAVTGFFGQAPDEMGFSALHPDIAGIKKAGEAGFYAGTAAQVAPIVGQAAKMLGKLTGSALNERLLSGQSLTPGISTPAPINFAVKPKGGTVLHTYSGEPDNFPKSKLDHLLADYRKVAARDQESSDELVDFIKKKAPKYFTTTFGTADDPLRTAIRERAIEPFGRDVKKIPPYLVDASKFPQARGHLQAKQELERMYDEMTGARALVLKPDDVVSPGSMELRREINQKMAMEGVPVEAQNAPSVDAFSRSDFEAYPNSTEALQNLVEAQRQGLVPSGVSHALNTGEVMFDFRPNMDLLSPENVVDALKQVPPNKLKNMSFPDALIQGTRALAPIRDYRAAIDMAERGAKLPPTVLQQFTKPVTPAPGGTWVQITDPVATELEGKLMNHSVGGYGKGDSYGTGYTGLPYGGKVAFDDGLVRVYSLRDKAGEPTITVEMARPKGQENWNVTQIRGRFNSEPVDKESVFSLLNKIDDTEGLGRIKPNSYTRSATGEDTGGSMVDWGSEYDKWKQGISE